MSLFVFVLSILLLIVSIVKLKLRPELALMLTALFFGLAVGLPFFGADGLAWLMFRGCLDTLQSIAWLIWGGILLALVLEKSGLADRLARGLLRLCGAQRVGLATLILGWLISIPVFCDSAFVLLAPLTRSLARQSGRCPEILALMLAGSLYSSHILLPPTPGPAGALLRLGLEGQIPLLFLAGTLGSLPALGGLVFWLRRCERRLPVEPALNEAGTAGASEELARPASDGRGLSLRGGLGLLGEAWRLALPILLVTAAGGALANVAAASPLAQEIEAMVPGLARLGLFFPFLVAALLRTALGSSTVSQISAAGLLAPLLPLLGLQSLSGLLLSYLAIAAGSMMVIQANDALFWLIAGLSGVRREDSYRLISGFSAAMGLSLMATVALASLVLL